MKRILLLGLLIVWLSAPALSFAETSYVVQPSTKSLVVRAGMTLDFIIERLYGAFPDMWPDIQQKLISVNSLTKDGELTVGQLLTLVKIIRTTDDTGKQQSHLQGIGYIVFINGNANAVNAWGEVRDLISGEQIFEGDSIITAPDSSVVLVMSDEAHIMLVPDSEFRIDRYRPSQSGLEGSAFLHLIRGGMRTKTGTFNWLDSEYEMSTVLATIGVHDADYAAVLCQENACSSSEGRILSNGLYVTALHGEIELVNFANGITISQGEYAYVEEIDIAPQLISSVELLQWDVDDAFFMSVYSEMSDQSSEPKLRQELEQTNRNVPKQDIENSWTWWTIIGLILLGIVV